MGLTQSVRPLTMHSHKRTARIVPCVFAHVRCTIPHNLYLFLRGCYRQPRLNTLDPKGRPPGQDLNLTMPSQGTPGTHDSTVYGTARASTRSFYVHHTAAIASAIVCADAQTVLMRPPT